MDRRGGEVSNQTSRLCFTLDNDKVVSNKNLLFKSYELYLCFPVFICISI